MTTQTNTTKRDFTVDELKEMVAHLTSKDVSSFSKTELMLLLKDRITSLKVKEPVHSFPDKEVFEAIQSAIISAGLIQLKSISSKVIFGIPTASKTGIRLVSITDISKKSRRKLTVFFGSHKLSSEVVELQHETAGTRTCGIKNQMQLTIDADSWKGVDVEAFKAEITRLATAVKANREAAAIKDATEKATERAKAKFVPAVNS